MAKRGRKPSEKRKGYFYEQEEQAVLDYIAAETAAEKDRIYNSKLRPAFEKMIESIIRRYKLYVPNEEFTDTFTDTLSFLVTKLDKFEPIIYTYEAYTKRYDEVECLKEFSFDEYEILKKNADEESPKFILVEGNVYEKIGKRYKAYSYLGTICKNHLIGRIETYAKELQRNPSYDPVIEEFSDNIKYSDQPNVNAEVAAETIKYLIKRIKAMLDNPKENDLKENEIKLGIALHNLFENWEYVLSTDSSNKLNKNAILLFLRESTGLDTKGIRDNMKKFRKEFLIIKNFVIS